MAHACGFFAPKVNFKASPPAYSATPPGTRKTGRPPSASNSALFRSPPPPGFTVQAGSAATSSSPPLSMTVVVRAVWSTGGPESDWNFRNFQRCRIVFMKNNVQKWNCNFISRFLYSSFIWNVERVDLQNNFKTETSLTSKIVHISQWKDNRTKYPATLENWRRARQGIASLNQN